jgi:O-antigen ligase
MIADNPWFGTGMGTFQWAFPPYRSPNISIRGIWDIAHSTPLELASDVGVPMALLVAAAWVIMFVILARGVFGRRRDGIIPLAAVATATLSLLHSCLDFTLQIPGYSIPFFGLFGVGMAQSFRSRELQPRAAAAPARHMGHRPGEGAKTVRRRVPSLHKTV